METEIAQGDMRLLHLVIPDDLEEFEGFSQGSPVGVREDEIAIPGRHTCTQDNLLDVDEGLHVGPGERWFEIASDVAEGEDVCGIVGGLVRTVGQDNFGGNGARQRDIDQRVATEEENDNGTAGGTSWIAGEEEPVLVVPVFHAQWQTHSPAIVTGTARSGHYLYF